MPYYFKHKKHTNGEKEHIGDDEVEALDTLQGDFRLSLEACFYLIMNRCIWEE